MRNLPILESEAVVERLTSRFDEREALIAFDADGTLWSGDVSDDVFLSACHEQWLHEAARPALHELAESLGLDASGSASKLGITLFEAQKVGAIDEVALYAAMTWCYAGYTLGELTDYAATVLLRKNIANRIRPEIYYILQLGCAPEREMLRGERIALADRAVGCRAVGVHTRSSHRSATRNRQWRYYSGDFGGGSVRRKQMQAA